MSEITMTVYEDPSERPIPPSYLARVEIIVGDSCDLGGQSKTLLEKKRQAETWARVLYGVIPESYLQKAFDRAFRNNDGQYIVTAYNLKTAYQEIAEGDANRTREAERAERSAARAETAEYTGVKCLRCRDTNVESIYKPDGTFLGARPGCNHLPVYPDDWLFKEHQRLEAATDVMFENARREGRNVTVAEMLAMSGIVKDMPKANVYDLKR
jgi:hypothetical protein